MATFPMFVLDDIVFASLRLALGALVREYKLAPRWRPG
jgi:hypothetical protein